MTAQQYLKDHGINDESIKRFHLSWDEATLNIPIKNKEDQIIWTKKRNLRFDPDIVDSKKYINESGTKAALFNIRSHYNKKHIVLCEGEMDAIRLDQEGIPAVSATAGSNTFNQELADDLKDKTIYIVYDNDEAGKNGIKKVLEYLPNARILELPLDSHDVCDFFSLHSRQDFIDILKEAKTKEQWELKYQRPEYKLHTLTELLEREYPEESWIIEKFLPTEGLVLFSGDAGVGKSFLTLEIIRSMVDNDIFLDHFQIKTSSVPILLIDKENGQRRLQRRLRGMGVPATDSVFFLDHPEKFSLEDAEFLQSIQNAIAANNIGIVIIDSLIDILIGDENSSTDTALIFNKLREIAPHIVWVVLHHEVKPVARFNPTAINRARGSSNIKAQVDYLFSLQKTSQPRVIHIEQGKARDYEMIQPFAVEFITTPETEEMGGFKYLGEIKDENSKVEEAILFIQEFLPKAPNSSYQVIVDAGLQIGIIEASIKRAVKTLKNNNIIDSIKDPNDKRRTLYFMFEGGDIE